MSINVPRRTSNPRRNSKGLPLADSPSAKVNGCVSKPTNRPLRGGVTTPPKRSAVSKAQNTTAYSARKNPRNLLRKRFEQQQIQNLAKISNNDLDSVHGVFADDNEIDKEKFQRVMISSGHTIYEDQAVVDALWNALDANHDHSIDQKELLVGLAALAGGDLEDKLKFTFKVPAVEHAMQVEYLHSKTDTNLTEELTLMITHLAKVKYTKNDDLTRFVTDFVTSTFETFDDNNDGVLSFEEFKQAAQGNKEVKDFFVLALEH